MANKQAIIEAIQAVADATGVAALRIAYGAPGAHVVNAIGESQPTGQAWEEPRAWPVVVAGVAAYLDRVRTISTSGGLAASDRVLQVAAPGVAVALPAPGAGVAGRYVVKALGVAGTTVTGTVDGAPGPHAVAAYGALRVYCDGAQWLTW